MPPGVDTSADAWIFSFAKPEGRKIIAHGVSRVE
jgi:hypothetical protein